VADKYPVHDEEHARSSLVRVAQHGTKKDKTRVYTSVKARYPHLMQSHRRYRGNQVTVRKFTSPEGLEYRQTVLRRKGAKAKTRRT
jgi:hypothetical protein